MQLNGISLIHYPPRCCFVGFYSSSRLVKLAWTVWQQWARCQMNLEQLPDDLWNPPWTAYMLLHTSTHLHTHTRLLPHTISLHHNANNRIKPLCFGWVDSISISTNLAWLICSSNLSAGFVICDGCPPSWPLIITLGLIETSFVITEMLQCRALSIILMCAKPLIG